MGSRWAIAVLLVVAGQLPAQDTVRVVPDDGWPDLSNFIDMPFGGAWARP